PAVARVDPPRVLVRVDALGGVGLERLAAVAGAVRRDASHVEVLLVAGVHADLAEVHGPRVDAVDARPALAAVGRFEDAAVLEAVRPLLVLDVLALAAVQEAERPVAAGTEDDRDLLRLLVALDRERDRVVRLVRPDRFRQS